MGYLFPCSFIRIVNINQNFLFYIYKIAENKTKATAVTVDAFLKTVDEKKVDDSRVLISLFEKLTGEKARMWGPSIIGFGRYHYRYESGREGDSMLIGFSPRKAKFSLYIIAGFTQYEHYLERLGKFKTAKSCLYVNKLADIDILKLKSYLV